MKGNPEKCDGPEAEVKHRKRLSRDKFDRKERESVLKEALVIEPPVSLTSVASRLNIHRTTLQKQFPSLSACLTERFHLYTLAQREERHKTTRKVALELINELAVAGLPPTRRNLQNATGEPLMPNDQLRKVLNEELQMSKEIRED